MVKNEINCKSIQKYHKHSEKFKRQIVANFEKINSVFRNYIDYMEFETITHIIPVNNYDN